MGSFDIQQIKADILNNSNIQNEFRAIAADFLNEKKKELMDEFNEHPVTVEIEKGSNAQNVSNTLAGRGNLFSFIGFDESFDPISPVRRVLDSIRLSSSRPQQGRNGVIKFNVLTPSRQELESVTKMPWESGRSWLYDIERAISGVGNYLYGKFKNSRSGTGVQVENNVNSATFIPVKYFGSMMQKFMQKLK
jgi:hypothetical protein